MIDFSSCVVFYYNNQYVPYTNTQSGTKIAYDYAVKNKKKTINLKKSYFD